MRHTHVSAVALAAILSGSLVVPARASSKSHFEVASEVSQMVGDSQAQQLAGRHGLQMVDVMWEDTGRYLGSSVGPNISDVTIEVEAEGPGAGKRQFLMPVMRFPNFTDKTGDVDIDKFMVRIGNQRDDGELSTVSLRELLAHPNRYMSLPEKGRIKGGSLLAKRDAKVLTSAQATFLPIRKGGKTRFWPVIFNYQSYEKNPAVLTLLVTRQGTSMTIIDNTRDTVTGGGSWGQRLYFNAGGKRAPLIAEREKDVKDRGFTANGEAASSLGEDANLMMIIQVPLKVKAPSGGFGAGGMIGTFDEGFAGGAPMEEASAAPVPTRARPVDIDRAVIGHGPTEGPYTELDGLTIERDERFPVRVTVQFYQATSNGAIDRKNVDRLAKKIARVYKEADYVGSLVIPDGTWRPTMWTGVSRAPMGLTWAHFPGLVARWSQTGWQHSYERIERAYQQQPMLYKAQQ